MPTSSEQLNIPTAANRRPAPYVWATWLADFIASDVPCRAKLVARALYLNLPKGDGVPPAWHIEHAELVEQLRAEDERDLAVVQTEVPIKVDVGGITIAGKMDVRSEWAPSGRVVVKDAKTGGQRVSDQVQVLLYQHMEVVSGRTEAEKVSGELVYKDGTVHQVPYSWWQEPAVQRRLTKALDAIRAESLEVAPSRNNCIFCPLESFCHVAWAEEAA